MPSFEAKSLNSIAKELGRRSKGLKHRVAKWECSREIEAPNDDERLNVDLEIRGGRQVRLSVWADGIMWFRICARGPSGWQFLLSFAGDCSGLSPEVVVDTLKESLRAKPVRETLSIWNQVAPEIESEYGLDN